MEVHVGLKPESQWQKDNDVTQCPTCRVSFTFFCRRSHCRSCGKVHCRDCIKEVRARVAGKKFAVPVKLCLKCAAPQVVAVTRPSFARASTSARSFKSMTSRLEGELPKMYWEEDSSSQDCRGCGMAFSLLNRRTHCRLCGLLHCHTCVTLRSVSLGGGRKFVQSCEDCCREEMAPSEDLSQPPPVAPANVAPCKESVRPELSNPESTSNGSHHPKDEPLPSTVSCAEAVTPQQEPAAEEPAIVEESGPEPTVAETEPVAEAEAVAETGNTSEKPTGQSIDVPQPATSAVDEVLLAHGDMLEPGEQVINAAMAPKSKLTEAHRPLIALTSLPRVLLFDANGQLRCSVYLGVADVDVVMVSRSSIIIVFHGTSHPFEFETEELTDVWVALIKEQVRTASSEAQEYTAVAAHEQEVGEATHVVPAALAAFAMTAPIATMVELVGSNRPEVNDAATVKYKHMLERDECVVLVAVAEKTRYMRTQRRLLVLTDRPRLFYADADSDKVKGFISLRASDFAVRITAPDSFTVTSHGKEYPFDLPESNADMWVRQIASSRTPARQPD